MAVLYGTGNVHTRSTRDELARELAERVLKYVESLAREIELDDEQEELEAHVRIVVAPAGMTRVLTW